MRFAKNMEFQKRLYPCLYSLKGEYKLIKIIQELNLPGGTTRSVVIKRKSKSSASVKEVEIQLGLDLFKKVDSEFTNKKE